MPKSALSIFLVLVLSHANAWADFEQDLAVSSNNPPALRALYARAAAGDAISQLNLGGLFFKGEEVEQDYAEGGKWFLKAANQGNSLAQFNLGMMYATGQGVSQSHAEAAKWYRLAALQGLAPAQINMGVAYAAGQGVPRNEIEAAKWMRLAALQGEPQAQFNLAVMYTNGQGVEKNYAEAHRWASLAAAQGHAKAKLLAQTLAMRTPEVKSAETSADAPPAAGDDYYLQLAAFKSQKEAEKYLVEMRVKLGDIDKPASIFTSDGWVRTQLGPYLSLEEARRNAKNLKSILGYQPLLKQH